MTEDCKICGIRIEQNWQRNVQFCAECAKLRAQQQVDKSNKERGTGKKFGRPKKKDTKHELPESKSFWDEICVFI